MPTCLPFFLLTADPRWRHRQRPQSAQVCAARAFLKRPRKISAIKQKSRDIDFVAADTLSASSYLQHDYATHPPRCLSSSYALVQGVVPLSVLSRSMQLLEVLCRSPAAEKLVRAYGDVGFLPLLWFTIHRRHIRRADRHLVKLFGVGPLGALDGAMQLRGARPRDEQAPAAWLADLLESSGEFAATIDLHGGCIIQGIDSFPRHSIRTLG
jgi:hypothetical protein